MRYRGISTTQLHHAPLLGGSHPTAVVCFDGGVLPQGIIQVEEFGMHMNEDGTLVYAMRVDAIQDRLADDLSLDMLSRLAVDVMQDSSKIAESLLSFYQRALIEMVFMGDELMRDKFVVYMATGIKPKLEASR